MRPNRQTKTDPVSDPVQRVWRVVRNHVFPVDDLREHSMNDCWCRPTEEEGVIIHNSLDGRELFERGERQLS